MLDYLRMVRYYLTKYEPQPPYPITGWQHIRSMDGPIHTVYIWWLTLTCSWWALGFKCWRKGHDWRDELITITPERELIQKSPGVIGFKNTGKRSAHKIRTCSRCGNYRGSFKETID